MKTIETMTTTLATDAKIAEPRSQARPPIHRLAAQALATAVRRHVSHGTWNALRTLRFELYLQRQDRKSRRRAARLASAIGLKLNLGSGFHAKRGWINVDLIDDADLHLDLREPLPFADGSVAEIYSEHFFEHLSYAGFGDSLAFELETEAAPSHALSLLRECNRVLAPGGLLDIAVPDAEVALREYVTGDSGLYLGDDAWWGPAWCDTPMHRVNYVFRQGHEHQYAYDFETLARVLRGAGFVGVARRAFDPARDHHNAARSLFVQAFKPAGPSTGER